MICGCDLGLMMQLLSLRQAGLRQWINQYPQGLAEICHVLVEDNTRKTTKLARFKPLVTRENDRRDPGRMMQLVHNIISCISTDCNGGGGGGRICSVCRWSQNTAQT